MAKTVSAERSLVGAALVSVVVAAVCSRSEVLSFGSFSTMALILIVANVVVYGLTKLGLFNSSARTEL